MWRTVKRFFAVWMICLSVIGCFIIWITEPLANGKHEGHSHKARNFFAQRPFLTSRCTRQLQLWTNSRINVYSDKPYRFSCPRVPCEASVVANTNISTTKMSDAVVLFPQSNWTWEKMHLERPWGQKWIFLGSDSPAWTNRAIIPPKKYVNNSYDYIMSYRRGSDFSAHFGLYDTTRPEIAADDKRNWSENKTGVVIGPAADCQKATWQRAKFVQELQSLVSVDMYGTCSDQILCSSVDECKTKTKSYKFTLALENSRCRDYITEKFFISLASGAIPIVDGPPRIDYERVAPPNAFIHVNDFSSVQALADYIKLLDRKDHLYNRFFDWKKFGSVVDIKPTQSDLFEPGNMCQIFERMHQDHLNEAVGVPTKREMPNWEKWWFGSCSDVVTHPE